jgi:phytoene dehydrogenase-like protein
MMKKSEAEVVIIGAGIAGLSLGCYLQMNGFNVQIFESHNTPGGLCTSWKRKGYLFDGCIHSTIAPSK